MPKRKYVQIKLVEDQIQLMRAEGMTNREIADHFGLNLKQVKNWVNRHNRAQRNLVDGIIPKPKGRPRKDGKPPNNETNLQKTLLLLLLYHTRQGFCQYKMKIPNKFEILFHLRGCFYASNRRRFRNTQTALPDPMGRAVRLPV